ncbi:hypothetical protein SALBM311S_09918 [Streptomyces alboniger]
MSLGVPGSRYDAQLVLAEAERFRAEPLVGGLPHARVVAAVVHRLDLVGEFGRPSPAQRLQRACGFVAAQPVEHLQARPLTRAQVDPRAQQPAQLHGVGVVVTMDVGDQDVADVAEVAPDGGQRLLEHLARLGDRPAPVDHDEAVVLREVLQQIDVDGVQAVVGQWQGNAVHSGLDGLDSGCGPWALVEPRCHDSPMLLFRWGPDPAGLRGCATPPGPVL